MPDMFAFAHPHSRKFHNGFELREIVDVNGLKS